MCLTQVSVTKQPSPPIRLRMLNESSTRETLMLGAVGVGGETTHSRSPSGSSRRPAYFRSAHTALHPITAVLLYQDDLAHWTVHSITACNHSLKMKDKNLVNLKYRKPTRQKRKLIFLDTVVDTAKIRK